MRFWSIFTVIALTFVLALSGTHSETIETVKVGEQKVSTDEAVPDAVPPELIYQATHNYPLRAKQLGDTGTVWLRVCIGVEGNVVDVILAKPSGSRSLDRAALRTAYKNEFEPAIQDGQPVRFWVQQAVKFKLADEGKPSIDDSVEVGIDSEKYKSVSGEFIPAEVEPEMTHQALPKYPPEAKEDGITGKVWVSILVDEQGEVREAKVAESSGSSLLDEAALEAADKNKYKPGIQHGCPAEVWVTYPVEFALTEVKKTSSGGEIEVKIDPEDSLPAPDEFISVEIMPEVIHQASPEYPLQAKQAGITGTVSVKALVDEEGKVLKATVAKSSGAVSLDEAALEAAYKCEYKPGIQDGHSVKVWVTYPVEFTLADEGKPSAGDSIEIKIDPEDTLPAPDEFILVDIRPELINEHNPDYPKLARQAGITGPVWVKALVDEEGNVLKAIVWESSGTVSLDEAALEAAYKCEYKPGIQDGHSVKVWVTYPVEFTLADEGKPSAGDSIEIKIDPEDTLPAPDEFILVDIRPELINEHNPDYPKLARQAGITGPVWVKALVDEEGNVLKAIVWESSGAVSLDEAAIEAAYKCEYKPGIQDGRPVKVWVTYPVEFTLADIDKPSLEGDIEVKIDPEDFLPPPDEFIPVEIMPEDYLPTPDEFVPVEEYPEQILEEPPKYPREAKKAGITGTVFVKVLVDEEGKVLKANVDKSSGTVSLDEAAVEAAYKCRYKPGIQNGRPIKVWVTYPVEFTLADVDKPSSDGEIKIKSDPDDYLPAPDEFILVDIRPELINEHNPDYPKPARQAGITGAVWVKALVDEEGNVLKAIVWESSGTVSLDEAAVEAAYKCKYKPGIQDGNPVKVWVTYPVDFTLTGK